MHIATVLGACPQFIKAAMVSRALAEHQHPFTETLIHTGQHFDANMSEVFFDELDIPRPDYNLGIGGGSHGQNTGRMLGKIEELLLELKPDLVMVYGDTDSTLAGALAAGKKHIPVAHVEAGLRSYNRRMPEELNRLLTDQLSSILFCPTKTAVSNLKKEGFPNAVSPGNLQAIENVGDVMYDAALYYSKLADTKSTVLDRHSLRTDEYILATVHRAENTDDPEVLSAVIAALGEAGREKPVVLPLHPRTSARLEEFGIALTDGILVIEPVGYLDMVMLERNASVIATDSGGVQKEAYFHGVPCLTLREETEWTELVELGWNRLAPPRPGGIARSLSEAAGSQGRQAEPYGDGHAANKIVDALLAKS